MPRTRRQSESCRKRQERQVLLAQQGPEPKFDLSECELNEIPSSVFTICRVLQKEVLLLNDNWLTKFNGGNLRDLRNLKVLDIHNNDLKDLPGDLGCLERLQVLNLENNKLKTLPDSAGHLRNLQTLNVKSNRLKELPESLCDLPSLRLLDISNNEITELPRRLAYVRTLETLVLDADKFKYPTNKNGFDYEPPSKFLPEASEPSPSRGMKSPQSERHLKTFQEEVRLLQTVKQFQQLMQTKRQETRTRAQQRAEEDQLKAEQAAATAGNRKHLPETSTQESEEHYRQLIQQQRQEAKEKVLAEEKRIQAQLTASAPSNKKHLPDTSNQESVKQYQQYMQKQRQEAEAKAREQRLAEEDRLKAELAASAANSKKHLLDTSTEESVAQYRQLMQKQRQEAEAKAREQRLAEESRLKDQLATSAANKKQLSDTFTQESVEQYQQLMQKQRQEADAKAREQRLAEESRIQAELAVSAANSKKPLSDTFSQETVVQYQQRMERQRQEAKLKALEQQRAEEDRLKAELAASAANNKKQLPDTFDQESVKQYQQLMQKQRQEAEAKTREQQLAEEDRLNAELAASAANNKKQLPHTSTEESEEHCRQLILKQRQEGKVKAQAEEKRIQAQLTPAVASTKKFLPDTSTQENVEQYRHQMQRQREEVKAKAREQILAEENRLQLVQAQLVTSATSNKKQLLDTITQDRARMDQQLSELSTEKDEKKKHLRETLNSAERRKGDLVSSVLAVIEKAKRTEALLEEREKDTTNSSVQ